MGYEYNQLKDIRRWGGGARGGVVGVDCKSEMVYSTLHKPQSNSASTGTQA